MDNIDSLVVSIHVIVGAAFVFTMAVMQLATGPAMARINPSEEKQKAGDVIKSRVMPAMDAAIVTLDITVFYFLYTRWPMIGGSILLMVKITFGLTALIIASLLHFYWRNKKINLKKAGKDAEFKSLSKLTLFLEKVVLTFAAITLVLGVTFNHW